jgi:hypothetical protein
VTLICSITKPYPLLLGDLALTGPWRSQGFPGKVPTVGQGLGVRNRVGGRYLTGFTQKVALLGPRLAMGWAGSPIAARIVLDAARDNFGNTGVEIAEMRRLLADLNFRAGKIDGLDLSLIGMSLPEVGDLSYFSFGHGKVLRCHSDFGDIFVSGSGTQHLVSNLQKIGRTAPFITDANLDSIHLGINKILLYTMVALVEELISAGTLKNFFGGGFQMILPTEQGLERLDEITYVFWFIKQSIIRGSV